MDELDKVLDEDEKILWQGKPSFLPFVVGGSIIISLVGIFWLTFTVPFFFVGLTTDLFVILFMLPFLLIGLGLTFGVPVYNLLVYKNVQYAITNKRAIIQGGLIGRDFNSIDFDKITDAEVNVGVFDKIFGQNTGSIMIATPAAGIVSGGRGGAQDMRYKLLNIQDPYEIFKFFKKISYDIKTDIEYPNKLRPKENPGYETEYTPKRRRNILIVVLLSWIEIFNKISNIEIKIISME
ncbi:PH domain-containing protein [Candidatus Micrarchaeota archaeon]|nr:PH domain-containing protein [Candidatus Micrarchaeota archaeon]